MNSLEPSELSSSIEWFEDKRPRWFYGILIFLSLGVISFWVVCWQLSGWIQDEINRRVAMINEGEASYEITISKAGLSLLGDVEIERLSVDGPISAELEHLTLGWGFSLTAPHWVKFKDLYIGKLEVSIDKKSASRKGAATKPSKQNRWNSSSQRQSLGEQLRSNLNKISEAEKEEGGGKFQRLLRSVSSRLVIHVNTAQIVEASGKFDLQVEDLISTLAWDEKTIGFKLEKILSRGKPLEEFLRGRVKIGPEPSQLWVELSKRDQNWTKELWNFNGSVFAIDDNLHLALKGKGRALPQVALRRFIGWIPQDTPPDFEISKLDLVQKGKDWLFAGEVQVQMAVFSREGLHSSGVGPVSGNVTFQGGIISENQSKRIKLSSTLSLGGKALGNKVRGGLEPLVVHSQFSGPFLLSGGAMNFESIPLDLSVSVPQSPCAHISETLAPWVGSDIQKFKLAGTFDLKLRVKSSGGGFESQVEKKDFSCKVTEVPKIYTKKHLEGPFRLERSPEDRRSYYVRVDPRDPGFTAIKTLPEVIQKAFVAAEDAGFWSHQGIDWSAIDGALKRNAQEKRIAVGGSTITMQTVKNLFLSRERTVARKAQELFLAWYIEEILSKPRILEIYLNIIEFGPGLYGVGRASKVFFGKRARDLTLKEAIYLASVLPAPNLRIANFCKGGLSPNYIQYMDIILNRMYNLKLITVEQYRSAASQNIEFAGLINPERKKICAAVKK